MSNTRPAKRYRLKKWQIKEIARRWAAGILAHGTDIDSFDDQLCAGDQILIVHEVHRIGKSLLKKDDEMSMSLEKIIEDVVYETDTTQK